MGGAGARIGLVWRGRREGGMCVPADAVFKALDGNQKEVVVGPVYKAAVESYRLTGVNVGAFSPR